ncbi:MAG: MetS family NSS transporter small subunit [Bacillaceae bacterium]|nr:MetS family NSS transporter small subunit [Bacillaceae bacterium]
MNGSAIFMMLFGFIFLWGGFGICVNIAMKKSKQNDNSFSA